MSFFSFFKKNCPREFKEECFVILRLGCPTAVTSFLTLFIRGTSVIICGKVSKIDLDVAALANSVLNILEFCTLMGLANACNTYLAQTFGGTDKKKVGVVLQRGIIVNSLFLFPLFSILLNIEPILLLLGQEKLISKMTAEYILLVMPGLVGEFLFLLFSRYLQSQNMIHPPMIVALIGNIFNVVSQSISVLVFQMGYRASAVCQGCTYLLMCVLIFLFIIITKLHKETWDGFSRESMYNWSDYLKLAVPGLFLNALEEWAFEIGTIVAGLLDANELAAQGIILQLSYWAYFTSPMAVQVAVSIRVGQKLGENDGQGALNCYKVASIISFCASISLATMLLIFKDYIGLMFTNSSSVNRIVSKCITLFAIGHIFDGITGASVGSLHGSARQFIAMIVMFICYYVIALPISIPLTLLTSLKVFGYWCGILIAITTCAILSLLINIFTDWEQQALLSQERINKVRLVSVEKTEKSKLINGSKSASDSSQSVENDEKVNNEQENFQNVLCKRLLIYSFCVLFFVGAIFIRAFLDLPSYFNHTTFRDVNFTLSNRSFYP